MSETPEQALARTVWLKAKAQAAGLNDIGDLSTEEMVALTAEWANLTLNVEAVEQRALLPEGFVRGTEIPAEYTCGAHARASLDAYAKRAGSRYRSTSRNAFEASLCGLIQASREAGRLFSPKLLELAATEGSEHRVIFLPQRVLKVTFENCAGAAVKMSAHGPWTFSASVPEYLQQLSWNREFLGDDMRVEGVMVGADWTSIVTSQRAIFGTPPTPAEANESFLSNGFVPLRSDDVLGFEGEQLMWWHPQVRFGVADTKVENLVKLTTGEIALIDAKAFVPEGEMAEWILSHLD